MRRQQENSRRPRASVRKERRAESGSAEAGHGATVRLHDHPVQQAIAGLVMSAAILWAYWPTLQVMVHQWGRHPDYSHGYLVLPIAAYFLWSRRAWRPVTGPQPSAWGGLLLLIAGFMRVVAGVYYMLPVDGWTFPIAIAGGVWLLYGWPWLRWALPSIVFLWFMTPIPYSAESWLSVPLQGIATRFSTAALVSLGQPAIAEGHTILLGDDILFVEEACSGLRIFVGIVALAFAFVLFSRWNWWQKAIILLSAFPVAIIANSIRIVTTGLLHQWTSGEAARIFSHDIAGFIMIPIAAAMFWLVLLHLERLFPEVEDLPNLSNPG